MSFLVDTHVLLWWLSDDARLDDAHRDILREGSNRELVSSISVAEMAITASIGKLSIPEDVISTIAAEGFAELPFLSRHAAELRALPWHHRDPFDRMLISQARVEGLTVLTADPRYRQYDILTR